MFLVAKLGRFSFKPQLLFFFLILDKAKETIRPTISQAGAEVNDTYVSLILSHGNFFPEPQMPSVTCPTCNSSFTPIPSHLCAQPRWPSHLPNILRAHCPLGAPSVLVVLSTRYTHLPGPHWVGLLHHSGSAQRSLPDPKPNCTLPLLPIQCPVLNH